MSVNKVTLVGHLGADPEFRAFPNGGSICNMRLATNYSYKDKTTGEKVTVTEWHRVVVRNGLAEIAQKYLKKGALVHFSGRNATRKWTDHGNVDHFVTEVICDDMDMLDSKKSSTDSSTNPTDSTPQQQDMGYSTAAETDYPDYDVSGGW